MQACFSCSAVIPEENRFCEECGSPATRPLADSETLPPCPRCGALPDDVDSEGFCFACGFRRAERGRDHLELEISRTFAGVTDRGLRHYRNDDYLALKELKGGRTRLIAVCDGVSSVQNPDQASAAAAEQILFTLEDLSETGQLLGEAELRSAIASAQERVCALPFTSAPDNERPATTVVAAVIVENTASIAWLGDSRAYWVDGEGARQLTTDHSWLSEVMAAGELSEQVALASPEAHAITRWLGPDAPDSANPAFIQFPFPGPGYLVLCSDGLWNYAPHPEDLRRLVPTEPVDALTLSRNLVEFARSEGGNDNITAVVLTVVPSDDAHAV